MKTRKNRKPMMGEAFDSHQRNTAENIAEYVADLRYYGKRRFAALIKEGESFDFEAFDDLGQAVSEWMTEADMALSEWAQKSTGCIYWSYGTFPDSGSVGFYINADEAIADADLQISDLSEMPRGFSGLAVLVNDHGNVTAYQCRRGKRRELFSVV